MKVLVTGGAGFIGSNFVRWLLESRPDVQVVNLDKLTYAGNLANLEAVLGSSRYQFVQADVADPRSVREAMKGCSVAIHFAAETHVDRSIRDAADFLETNVLGTYHLLEAAREMGLKRFIHISTDEVYGSLLEGEAREGSPIQPNSPYAASKAAADHMARAYHVTYGLPVVIVRASNNFGPYQYPEKFLPLLITHALENEPLPIYGDGLYVREWLFVTDFCEAIDLLCRKGSPGEVYNVGSGNHQVNLDLARRILSRLGKPPSLLRHVADRLGHDRRYAVSWEKIRALGWKPRRSFEESLDETIRWYQTHEEWWRPLKERVGR